MIYANSCKALQMVQKSLIPTFTAITRVQIPSGTPNKTKDLDEIPNFAAGPKRSIKNFNLPLDPYQT